MSFAISNLFLPPESFEKLTKQPTLEIVYEPCDLPLEVVLKPLQTLTLRNVNYFYKKDHFGTAMNTFLCFCHNNDEMAMIKGIIDNEPTIWQRHGIKTIRGILFRQKLVSNSLSSAYLRGSIVLTHVDDPVPCPMVVSETLLRHNRLFECPPELVVSEHRPGMMVEVWLDNQHPSNKSKNFDPFLKQVHFSETSYHVRRLIQTASNFKIEFIRQLAAERIPWAWIGSVKANGENIESKVSTLRHTGQIMIFHVLRWITCLVNVVGIRLKTRFNIIIERRKDRMSYATLIFSLITYCLYFTAKAAISYFVHCP